MCFFQIKYRLTSFIASCGMLNRLLRCNRTCYCIGMVSVMSTLRYLTSASRYQSRASIYMRGLIPRILAEAVPIEPVGRNYDNNINILKCMG